MSEEEVLSLFDTATASLNNRENKTIEKWCLNWDLWSVLFVYRLTIVGFGLNRVNTKDILATLLLLLPLRKINTLGGSSIGGASIPFNKNTRDTFFTFVVF